MALSPNQGSRDRSFGDGVGRVAHYVQRGVRGVLAATGLGHGSYNLRDCLCCRAVRCRTTINRDARLSLGGRADATLHDPRLPRRAEGAGPHRQRTDDCGAHLPSRGTGARAARDTAPGRRQGADDARLDLRGLRRLRQGTREGAPGQPNGQRATPRYEEKDAGTIKWIG